MTIASRKYRVPFRYTGVVQRIRATILYYWGEAYNNISHITEVYIN